jgi:hypothetical protein
MGEPAGIVNLETARRYLQALEPGETGAALRDYFAPDAVFEAFPNRLRPLGETLNLASALENVERGKKAMSHQKYKIKQEIADRDQVALEVEWVERLAVPFQWEEHQAAELRLLRGLAGNAMGKSGEYDGTVLGCGFVVPFRHCPERSK